MTERWRLSRGATVVEGGVRFEVWAPRQERLRLQLYERDAPRDYMMTRDERGVWSATVAGARPGARYAYVLDDGEARPDPVSRLQPDGVHGPSLVVDPAAYRWSDAGWRGRPMRDLVIYELHVGTFTPARSFDGVIAELPRLRALGITAIELMPVAEFPGARNWGYDGVDLYAPHHAYGGPEGLRRLVDAAHASDLAVILDVVYNHLGPEGNYLGQFGPYFTETYRTPWGSAVNYDAAGSDEVRRFVTDNARYWTDEYHIDGLRLDAVHAIYDFSARHILRDIADAVHEQGRAAGREAVVIAESDLNDPRIVRQAPREGYGCDAQWSDDFHHAVHAAITGERAGYYADFGAVNDVALAYRERFVYAGRHSAHRDRRHGAPAADLSGDRFVVAIQNHDQVGNRAAGDRLDAVVPLEPRKLAASALLLAPYVPLLFMGEEYGESHPFLYFVSHGDPDLVRAVREGRRREFAAFGWASDVPDPQAEETFARSTLDPAGATAPRNEALRALYRDLLALRAAEPALRAGAAEVSTACDERGGWVRLILTPHDAARSLMALFNFSGQAARVPLPDDGWAGRWSSADAAYGGGGGYLRVTGGDEGASARVPAHAAELYGRGAA